MESEVVSVGVIKPSTPTPSHLRTHQFSILDQYIPHGYLSVPIFYSSPTNTDPSQTLSLLKNSLSKTLTLFYPLAGRVKDDYVIDCNDEGIKFVHAQVRHCTLSQALSPPEPNQLNELFPKGHTSGGELLGIQVNFFECGGIAICIYFSHKIADARSLCTFLLGWSSIANCGDEDGSVVRPRFDLASVFPPIQLPPSSSRHTEIPPERVVNKVFRFEASKIAELKAKAKGSTDDGYPSKMMAITAFLWTIFAAMGGQKRKPRPCILAVAVNLRGRVRTDPSSEEPSLHEHTIGNLAVTPLTPPIAPPSDLTALPDLVKVIKDLVRTFDESGLVKRRDGGEFLKIMDSYLEAGDKASASEGELALYDISSWIRFPFYEADFGWGKPVWFGVLNGAFKNVIMYLDAKNGEGVEAWVTMTEEDMAVFESMPELLEFATPVQNALDH